MSSLQQQQQQRLQQQPSSSSGGSGNKSIIEIYTDWANHYLDKLNKGRGQKRIKNLQTELADGIVLADVCEAVTGHKVHDIVRKSKMSQTQMVSNIQHCLNHLASRGVTLTEDITAKDIKDGSLKAILGLFFQMSRYKQQQKLVQDQARSGTPRIPSVPSSPAKSLAGGGSNIPSPAKKTGSSLVPKMGKNLSQSKLASPSAGSGKVSMLERFRMTKPNQGNSNQTHSTNGNLSNNGSTSSLIQQPHHRSGLMGPGNGLRYQHQQPIVKGLGKRTSSSSGFSSARSVGSESSVASLCSSDTNFPSPSALRRINENSTFSSPNTSPQKLPPKGKPVQKIAVPSSSPKRSSPKFARSNTEIKDYGPIDAPLFRSNIAKPSGLPTPKSSFVTSSNKSISRPISNSSIPSALKTSPNSVKTSPVQLADETCEANTSFGSGKKSNRSDSNVAVVSPMPSLKKGASIDYSKVVEEVNNDDTKEGRDEDVLSSSPAGTAKAPMPMAPIFAASTTNQGGFNQGILHTTLSGTRLVSHLKLVGGITEIRDLGGEYYKGGK